MKRIPSFGIIIVALIILLIYFLPIKFLINFYDDDGFFYLKTANNFATGIGSTFDGINKTNGYHPLWFIFLACIYFFYNIISTLRPETIVRVTSFLHFLIFLATGYFVFKSINNYTIGRGLSKFFLFLSISLTLILIRNFGTEIHISILLFSAYLYLKSVENNLSNNKRTLLKVLLFAFLGLSRIDYFFSVIPVFILFESYSKNLKQYFTNILRLLLPLLIISLVYFLINYIYFGHFLTISGTIKNAFPKIILFDNVSYIIKNKQFFKIAITSFFGIIFLAFLLKIYFRRKEASIDNLDLILLEMSTGISAFYLLNMLFNTEGLREWYLGASSFAASLILIKLLNEKMYLIKILTVSFVAFFLIYFYSTRIKSNKYSTAYDFALALKENTNYEDKIIQMDFSGLIGLFSERILIDGDGLMNSFEYHGYIKNSKLNEYIKEKQIDYYSTYSAKVDSTSKTVIDTLWSKSKYGGYDYIFPLHNIKLRMTQKYESIINPQYAEWYLIKVK